MFFRGAEQNKGGLGGSRAALRVALITGMAVVLAVVAVIYSRKITSLLSPPSETPTTPAKTTEPEPERWIQLPIVSPPHGPGGVAGSGTTGGPGKVRPTPAELKDVKDGTPIEREAFYWLLGRADKEFGKSDLALEEAPDTKVADLYDRPAEYRGKPVLLTGIVRNLKQSKLAENPAGLEASTEADLDVRDKRVWVAAPRAGLNWKAEERVRVTGYFFKIRLATDAEGRQALEPVVVLTNIEPVKSASPAPERGLTTSPGVPSVETMGMIFALLLMIYFALMFYTRRRQKAHFEKLETLRRKRRRMNAERDESGDEEELQPPPADV